MTFFGYVKYYEWKKRLGAFSVLLWWLSITITYNLYRREHGRCLQMQLEYAYRHLTIDYKNRITEKSIFWIVTPEDVHQEQDAFLRLKNMHAFSKFGRRGVE